ECRTKRKNGSSELKQLRKFYREGKLDAHVNAFRAYIAIGGAVRAFIKQHYPSVKLSDEAIRLLRLKLPQSESNSSELTSLLSKAFTALLQGGRRRSEGCHVRAWPGLPRESSDAVEEKAAPMEAANAREEEHLDAGSAAEQTEPTPMNNDTADSDHSASEVIWIPPPRVAEAKLTLREALGDGDSSSSNEETEPTEALTAGNYYVRSITNSYIRDGRRVYKTKLVTPAIAVALPLKLQVHASAASPSPQISLVNTVTPKRTAPSYLIRFFSDVKTNGVSLLLSDCYSWQGLRPPPPPPPADAPGTRALLLRSLLVILLCGPPF
ncbi:hypothetical protein GN958_ATG13482, partial [Phytophthora infestans]